MPIESPYQAAAEIVLLDLGLLRHGGDPIFSPCDERARVKNMTEAPKDPRHLVARVVCGLQPLRSGKPFAASPITAKIGGTMLRPEQFVISAMPDIEVTQDGRRCLIHATDMDGKRIDLAFAPEVAPGLANGILSAASSALASADGEGRLAASLVRGFRVEASLGRGYMLLVLLTGAAEMPYALPPKLSARLRADLQAAELAALQKTHSAERGAQ